MASAYSFSDVTIFYSEKELMNNVFLTISEGDRIGVVGRNGAGKSTLGYTIMGSPRYEVTGGEILFKGKKLLEETADQRAKDGIFLSFQNPLEVPGVKYLYWIEQTLRCYLR